MVVLPRVGAGSRAETDGNGHGRELLRERSLVVKARDLWLGRRSRLHGRIVGREGGLRHVGRMSKGLMRVRGLNGNSGDDRRHVSRFLERRSGLIVVVANGNAANRLGGRRGIAVEGGIRGHGRSGRHASAHHCRLRVVGGVGPGVRPRGGGRGNLRDVLVHLHLLLMDHLLLMMLLDMLLNLLLGDLLLDLLGAGNLLLLGRLLLVLGGGLTGGRASVRQTEQVGDGGQRALVVVHRR